MGVPWEMAKVSSTRTGPSGRRFSHCRFDLVSLRRVQSAASRAIRLDRKSTRLNSSHQIISYAVFCLKKKKDDTITNCGDAALPFCGMCPLQVCLAVG